jgi:hypothetical protein
MKVLTFVKDRRVAIDKHVTDQEDEFDDISHLESITGVQLNLIARD